MVWAVMICALLVCSTPCVAFAEDVVPDSGVVVEDVPIVPSQDFTGAIDNLRHDLLVSNDVQSQKLDTLIELNKPETPVTINDMTELDYLASIDAKLDGLEPEEVEIEQQESKAAVSINTFTAYQNVSPTGAYASYAKGLLPKVGFNEHYCFLQDSNSSYVFVWGDLQNGNSITGTDVSWVRWYYANNSVGYVEEFGGGDVTIQPNSHVILTDLGNHPMLDANDELFRKEVGYYAVVAVAIFSLVSVWSFVVRLRGAISV